VLSNWRVSAGWLELAPEERKRDRLTHSSLDGN
jgi:hypothetical protein